MGLGYVESALAPGEQIRHRARYHWWHYRAALGVFVLGALLGVVAFLASRASPGGGQTASALARVALLFGAVAGFLFVLRYVQASAVEMVVTSARAIVKRGIFRRVVAQADVAGVRSTALHQGALGRSLGFGTVTVEAAGQGGPLAFEDIREPGSLLEAVRGAPVAAGEARP